MTNLFTTPASLKHINRIVDTQGKNSQDISLQLGDLNYNSIDNLSVSGKDVQVSEWAMSQLCQKLSIPYTYMKNCDKLNPSLASYNFTEWKRRNADKPIMLRMYDNEIIGVLSDKYTKFDNDKVIDLLDDTKLSNYNIVGHYVSPERLTLRLTEQVPFIEDLYCSVQVDNSQVGKYPFSIIFMVYKQICTNGLIIKQEEHTVVTRRHVGNFLLDTGNIKNSLTKIEDYRDIVKEKIQESMQDKLSKEEVTRITNLLVDKRYISKETVADGSFEQLVDLYGRTRWGIVNILTQIGRDQPLDKRLEIESYAGKLVA